MMGERTAVQEALFYEFSLERHVPSDHLLRSIDRFVDLAGIRSLTSPSSTSQGGWTGPSNGPISLTIIKPTSIFARPESN
jgi:hypothetical protein